MKSLTDQWTAAISIPDFKEKLMDLRHPVHSLTWALLRAMERDLDGVDSPAAADLFRTSSPNGLTARPEPKDCAVVLFSQSWSTAALGYDRADERDAFVDAETTVVTGPCGDACVYVSTQLLYHVRRPNRRFFLDVAAQQMRGRCEVAGYEGRDTADEEAFDYEIAGTLARVRSAVRQLGHADAQRIARRLHDCADELSSLAPA